jgi:hypothetical protein
MPKKDYNLYNATMESVSMAKKMQSSPKTNPAGKGKFIPNSILSIAEAEPKWRGGVKIAPDPAASSRGANVRANKERGTRSSTQRKVIK